MIKNVDHRFPLLLRIYVSSINVISVFLLCFMKSLLSISIKVSAFWVINFGFKCCFWFPQGLAAHLSKCLLSQIKLRKNDVWNRLITCRIEYGAVGVSRDKLFLLASTFAESSHLRVTLQGSNTSEFESAMKRYLLLRIVICWFQSQPLKLEGPIQLDSTINKTTMRSPIVVCWSYSFIDVHLPDCSAGG